MSDPIKEAKKEVYSERCHDQGYLIDSLYMMDGKELSLFGDMVEAKDDATVGRMFRAAFDRCAERWIDIAAEDRAGGVE